MTTPDLERDLLAASSFALNTADLMCRLAGHIYRLRGENTLLKAKISEVEKERDDARADLRKAVEALEIIKNWNFGTGADNTDVRGVAGMVLAVLRVNEVDIHKCGDSSLESKLEMGGVDE